VNDDYDDESSALAHQQELEKQQWESAQKAQNELNDIREELRRERIAKQTTKAA